MRWLEPPPKIKHKLTVLLPIVLLVLATIIQAVKIAVNRSLTLDEAVTLTHSFAGFNGKWLELFADIHMPVYNVLAAAWMGIFGFDVLTAKMFSIVCAVGALLSVFVFVDRALGRRVAFGSIALLAFSPLFIQYAQLVRSYELFVVMATVSSIFFLRLNERGFAFRTREMFFYVIATTGLLATHMVGAAMLVVQALFVLFVFSRDHDRARLARWAGAAAVVVLAYAPIAATILSRYDLETAIPVIYSWVERPDLRALLLSVSYSATDPLEHSIGFACLILWAIVKRAEKSDVIVYLALWLCVPALLLFAYSHLHHPVFIKRGLITSLVPFLVLVSFGISRLGRGQLVGAVFALAVVVTGAEENYRRRVLDDESWRGLVEAIRDSPKENRSIAFFVRPGYAWQPFLYHINRECLFYEVPQNCMSKFGIVAVGGSTMNGDVPLHDVNWFVGYGSDVKHNRSLIDEMRASGIYRNVETFPDFRGLEVVKFETAN
ncbi:MAG: glycosyltransferase family 39 protein [Bdellovibrionota bacterium]